MAVTGFSMVLGGLALGLHGAVSFNFERMIAGWLIAGAGAVLIFARLLQAWMGS